MVNDKTISIFVQTYNHEKYITQCLQSILDQKLDYLLEINVVDDFSNDRTREILKEFKQKYPDKINLFLNEKNLGHIRTQLVTYKGFKTLQGKYIAMIEGDDYWSDNVKLQKQISFLEANSDFVGCGHNVVKVYEDGSKEPHRLNYWEHRKEVLDVDDCIMVRTFFHMSSLVLRNVFKNNWPKFLSDKYSCDLIYPPLFAQYGKIKSFDEDMGVYRAHGGGVFSNKNLISMHLFEIDALRRYNKWLKYKYFLTYASCILHRISYLFEIEGKKDLRELRFFERLKIKALFLFYIIFYILAICIFSIFFFLSKNENNSVKHHKKNLMRFIKKSFDKRFPALHRVRKEFGHEIKSFLKSFKKK